MGFNSAFKGLNGRPDGHRISPGVWEKKKISYSYQSNHDSSVIQHAVFSLLKQKCSDTSANE
jgi:hypothetical protein